MGSLNRKAGVGVLWSLVVQVLSMALVSALMLWLVSQLRLRLQVSTDLFIISFRFGRNLLAEGMLEILFLNSCILVIGQYISAEVTELYLLAKKTSAVLTSILQVEAAKLISGKVNLFQPISSFL